MRRLYQMILFCVVACAVHANDGSYTIQGTGGAVMPIKNNAVTMEKEVISIDVSPISENDFAVQYTCIFDFKNKTDAEQRTLIGFPHRFDVNMSQENELFSKEEAIKDFKFFINDKEVKFEKYTPKENPELASIPAYDVVYATEVVFLPGESKTIKNTYSLYKYINCVPNPIRGQQETEKTIDYILKTGSSWKEPIGSARIIVTFHDRPGNYFSISRKSDVVGLSNAENRFVFSYNNFVPNDDFKIFFRFNKQSNEETMKQLNEYFGKKDFVNVEHLLWKWDITSIWDKKNNAIKDFIRNIAYKTAYHYYKTKPETALSLYFIALHHARSHTEHDYLFIEYPEYREDFYPTISKWEHEGEKNSPCYFIVYNIACIYSMKRNLEKSKFWFEAACQMKPSLREYAKNDPDMKNLIENLQ